MAHKFNPGDKVTIAAAKQEQWVPYWKVAGGTWGDFTAKEYTISEWDGDAVTPGYKLVEVGYKSLAGAGSFVESWFELAPIKYVEGKESKDGVPGHKVEGKAEGKGEESKSEGKQEKQEGKPEESKESKDGKKDGKESKEKPKESDETKDKEMPKKEDKKDKKDDKKDKKDEKDSQQQQENKPIKVKDMPSGRIGRYTGFKNSPNYMFVIKQQTAYGNSIIQFWPGYDLEGVMKRGPGFTEIKDDDDYFNNTEVELLPVDTSVTLCFNGEWDKVKEYV